MSVAIPQPAAPALTGHARTAVVEALAQALLKDLKTDPSLAHVFGTEDGQRPTVNDHAVTSGGRR